MPPFSMYRLCRYSTWPCNDHCGARPYGSPVLMITEKDTLDTATFGYSRLVVYLIRILAVAALYRPCQVVCPLSENAQQLVSEIFNMQQPISI